MMNRKAGATKYKQSLLEMNDFSSWNELLNGRRGRSNPKINPHLLPNDGLDRIFNLLWRSRDQADTDGMLFSCVGMWVQKIVQVRLPDRAALPVTYGNIFPSTWWNKLNRLKQETFSAYQTLSNLKQIISPKTLDCCMIFHGITHGTWNHCRFLWFNMCSWYDSKWTAVESCCGFMWMWQRRSAVWIISDIVCGFNSTCDR